MSGLPAELLAALESERAQYRGLPLSSVDARLEDELIALRCVPSPEPDWAGGTFHAFDDRGPVWGGEVLHVDAPSGELFVLPSKEIPAATELARATSWTFKPFDFSQALVEAGEAATGRFADALRWVHDGAPEHGRAAEVSSLDEPWASRWGLLWGPPGTGKTQALATKLVESILARPGARVLVVAPTNGAVDELTHRLCSLLSRRSALLDDEGRCRVFRGGVGARARLASEFPQCLHDDDPARRTGQRDALQRELSRLVASGASPAEIAHQRAALKEVERLEDATLLAIEQGRASVIAVTVHRALRLVKELGGGPRFAKLVIDEGGMVSRAAAALLSALAESVLVAGDPKQLGPVARAGDGTLSHVQRWLRESPLSHLVDAAADVRRSNVCLLREQHRMHPAISQVVSGFQYAGRLVDGARPRTLATEPPLEGFPAERAAWVVLDECGLGPRALSHARPEAGRGYERRASAELLVGLAERAVGAGHSVLAATPYRAQAQLINALGAARGLERLVSSTIHRQQGAEFDVVLIDTVAGGRPFAPTDLCAMLNVAASRARRHLLVFASRAEAEGVIPGRFLSSLARVRLEREGAALEPIDVRLARAPAMPRAAATLGDTIANLEALGPLFTREQLELFERNFGEGHWLVRGVAGSGKTFVLAHWAARMLAEHRGHRVLISYFTRSLQALEVHHLKQALAWQGLDVEASLARVHVAHVDELKSSHGTAEYDAVFVDEAQDMGPERLRFLFHRARELLEADGKRRRRFFLFMDDSQNVYGQRPIEELRALVPGLDFRGRSRVMKESFRSPREHLELAFNVVLDPLHLHGVPPPGLREFLKEGELVKAGLLTRPGGNRELYRVGFTERGGALPKVLSAADVAHEGRELVRVVKMLQQKEQVRPGDILVISPTRPRRWAEELSRAGFPAVAFGGAGGESPASFPAGRVDFVRTTTVFSSKGHESPVVIFCGLEELDALEETMSGTPLASPELTKRSLFYVGATRASVRQYLLGLERGRFVRAARAYVEKLAE